MTSGINRLNYYNREKNIDFEIRKLKSLFESTSLRHLSEDFRLNFWVIINITEGEGIHYVDFKPYKYKSGDIIFVQKNQVQRFIKNADVAGYIMFINEPFLFGTDGINGNIFFEYAYKIFGFPISHMDDSVLDTNRKLMELLYREYGKDDEKMCIELMASIFQSFIILLQNQTFKNTKLLKSRSYEIFNKYRHLVEENFRDKTKVGEYSEMMHLSKKTINEATKSSVGLSAKQYIIDRVLIEIKRYLSEGELLNYEIADILGFSETGNMTNFFKRYAGKSPREFRYECNNFMDR